MNTYALVTYVTYITGNRIAQEESPTLFATLDAAKDYIAVAQAKRGHWDNDGFTRKVEYIVRYGSAVNGWDARQYVCTFAFDDCFRSYATAYDRIVSVECSCGYDKDHARNKRDGFCIA